MLPEVAQRFVGVTQQCFDFTHLFLKLLYRALLFFMQALVFIFNLIHGFFEGCIIRYGRGCFVGCLHHCALGV